jgi:hypothetical protein
MSKDEQAKATDAGSKTKTQSATTQTPDDAVKNANSTGKTRKRLRQPRDPLPLGLDREDMALARSRAAADIARDRRYRFWRGVAILCAVAVVLVLWAYSNAAYLGLPVDRWEREVERAASEIFEDEAAKAGANNVGTKTGNVPEPGAASGGLDIEELREIERLLAELDFDPGPVDGEIDAATQEAIREYQAIADTAKTGEASRALLRDLREVSAIMKRGENAPD